MCRFRTRTARQHRQKLTPIAASAQRRLADCSIAPDPERTRGGRIFEAQDRCLAIRCGRKRLGERSASLVQIEARRADRGCEGGDFQRCWSRTAAPALSFDAIVTHAMRTYESSPRWPSNEQVSQNGDRFCAAAGLVLTGGSGGGAPADADTNRRCCSAAAR